jgi:catechol 2,3-dioxygenase-like lactoylglutathione lyase family enzyme
MTDTTLDHWSSRISTMLIVDEIDTSIAFYRDLLGFVVRESDKHIALLQAGAMWLYLITESPPTVDKPNVTLTNLNSPDRSAALVVLRVEDCWAIYQHLSEKGAVFLTPPHSPSWGGWRCFMRDPNGYTIEIEQP